MSNATNTVVTVKNVGNGAINVYRDETKSETVGITYAGYGFTITNYNADKSKAYAPAYGGWIDTANLTITKEKPLSESVDSGITVVPATLSELKIDTATSNTADAEDPDSSTMSSIIGMPYQFMSRVDRRIDNGFGRKYSEKIKNRDNFVYITPGKQIFMPGADGDTKAQVLNALTDMAISSSPEGIITAGGRYYGLETDTSNYYKYVNPACRSVAILLGIGNEKITIGSYTESLKKFNWQTAKNSTFLKNLGAVNGQIVIYPDGLNQISEDFGNSTRESSLVSQINGYSDTIKEINYFMNGSADSAYANMLENESFNTTLQSIQSTINNFTGGHGVLQAMLGNSTTILSGGKLVFPEMWSDSDYDRSYSVDIKLRSPDADVMSIYLNLIVPTIHLMALTAPRDFDAATSSNGYVAPFLVRAYARSLFNIELGIITSLNISRGGEGNWAVASNLPTSIDISLSIKDLYKSMYMSKTDSILEKGIGLAKFVSNDAEMEQLMNFAGINMTQTDVLQKRWGLYAGLAEGQFTTALGNIGAKAMEEFYKKIISKIWKPAG